MGRLRKNPILKIHHSLQEFVDVHLEMNITQTDVNVYFIQHKNNSAIFQLYKKDNCWKLFDFETNTTESFGINIISVISFIRKSPTYLKYFPPKEKSNKYKSDGMRKEMVAPKKGDFRLKSKDTKFNPKIHVMVKNPNGKGYIQKFKSEVK